MNTSENSRFATVLPRGAAFLRRIFGISFLMACAVHAAVFFTNSVAAPPPMQIVTCSKNANLDALIAQSHVSPKFICCSIDGFAAPMDVATIQALKADPHVRSVEADGPVTLRGQTNSFGLARIGADHFPVAHIKGHTNLLDVDVAMKADSTGGKRKRLDDWQSTVSKPKKNRIIKLQNPMKPMRILSIDGGGIRGIIPGQVLVALEHMLQKLSGNDPGVRIADAFDLIAGTSTGGILTCLYLCPHPDAADRPRFSAEEAVDLYLQNGDDIFDISLFKRIESLAGTRDEKYSAATLEKVLKNYLGDLKLSQLIKPCLITSYDIARRKAKFFDQADVMTKKLGDSREFYLRDVARATSAAPTYFEPANITAMDQKVYPLVDGGVFANNPAMCACVEAFSLNPDLKVTDLYVLSLGTGEVDKPYSYAEARNWGKLEWIIPVLDVMMSGVSETVDYQLKALFSSANCSSHYLRLQVNLQDFPDADSAMDNASEKNMRALKKTGETLAADKSAELELFAKALLYTNKKGKKKSS